MPDACVAEKKNLGLVQCNKLPGMIKGMITTPKGFSITPANAVEADEWQDALLAAAGVRIYLWPPFDGVEDVSEDAVYEDTPLSINAVRDGQYRFRISISQNLCFHKAAFTHRGKGDRVFLVDVNNRIFGTEDSDGNMRGFKISLLNTEKLKFSDGSVSTKTPIYLGLADNLEIDNAGLLLDAPFIGELVGIVDVELALTATPHTATKIYVTVTSVCDGTAVSGLVAADFVITDTDDGADHAITSVVEANGVYTITGVGFEACTLSLESAATLSIEGYELLETLAVPAP